MSVVVPCYRYGHYLTDAVESVLAQKGVETEVIVIDDASDDDSAHVARRLAEQDARVRVVVHERNAGHIATYNEGLALATGDYVLLLSADDALAPGALSRAVSLMQRFPRVGMVYGHAEAFSDELPGAPRQGYRARSWSVWPGRRWVESMCGRAVNPVYTPSAVLRREAWEEISRYDGRVPHAADMLLWYQIAVRWDIGRVNNAAQAYYRVHGSNMHLTQYAGMLRDLREQREVVRILFDEPVGGSRPSDAVRTAGLRSMARRARRLAAAELREGPTGSASAEFRSFSTEILDSRPAARPSAAQRGFDAWIESSSGTLLRRGIRHVEWRRWRRYGI